MLKIHVVSAVVALIHCSVGVLVQLDSTDFGSSPCGWTLQNFTQYGSKEATEDYNIQSTGDQIDEDKYLVLTEIVGRINREYQLKQSAEIEVRFKYYQAGGLLQLLYLEADNSVPVHLAYSHDGEEGSVGWKSGEAHISRSATEQPFTILFEATTKDPKVDPVALDSVTILFEDVRVYRQSRNSEDPVEYDLRRALEPVILGIPENDRNQNLESKSQERPFKSFDSSLELTKRKTNKDEIIKIERQERLINGTDSSGDSVNQPESNEENPNANDNEANDADGQPQADGNDADEPPQGDSNDADEPPQGDGNDADEPPQADGNETNNDNPDSKNDSTKAPQTNADTPETENNQTEPSGSVTDNSKPETDDQTPKTESNSTKSSETSNNTITEVAPQGTEAPNQQEVPRNTTKSPEGVTTASSTDQQDSENENSTQTKAPPKATTPPSKQNTTLSPVPETTKKVTTTNSTDNITVAAVPSPVDKETTVAPENPEVTEPAEPTPMPSPPPPQLTTAAVTAKPDPTATSKTGNTDEQEGSEEESGFIHMWYIPVTIVVLVVFGVVLFRYMQLKRRRGGYARTESTRGGDYTNPAFNRDAGDDSSLYDRGGRSYDTMR